jgi:hypothetical protein
MLKILSIVSIVTYSLYAGGFYSKVSPISPELKQRMIKGNSWRYGCPVGLDNLRYLEIKYWNFKGDTDIGELIVHEDVANSITNIFKELYAIKYPIKQMKLVSNFHGSDWKSIEADNTSALNCRKITGNKKKWSNHAYGKAVDINPIENPYVSKTGYISHKNSIKYRKRVHNKNRGIADKALLLKYDKATKIFEKHGWKWGGNWKYIKDYQHFECKKRHLKHSSTKQNIKRLFDKVE